jgi:hypothetical protein
MKFATTAAIILALAYLVHSAGAQGMGDAMGDAMGMGSPNPNLLESIPVTGTLSNGPKFNGLLHISDLRINSTDFQLLISGQLRSSPGNNLIENFTNVLAELVIGTSGPAGPGPVGPNPNPPQAVCDILILSIDATHLNLLGLDVNIDPIRLDVTAQAGPGKVLGNLLCDLANLLNELSGLPDLIDQIVEQLQ